MVACPSCRDRKTPSGVSLLPGVRDATRRALRSRARGAEVVTALFCDLVGFTAISESADPEDVDRMLAAYFAMARAQIEAHGGVVEKFIGDAVVGVFGVPAAHEDDPERAVRAGLRIARGRRTLRASTERRSGSASGSTRAKPSCAWVSPPARARASSPGTRSTPRRGSSRSRPRWGSRSGSATYEATAAVSTTRSWSRRPSRARPSRYASSTPGRPRTLRGRSDPDPRHALRRSGDRPRAAEGHLRQDGRADSPQLVTIVGEPGLGQEPDRRRARRLRRCPARARDLASGPLPPVRRGHHVLGARRDREGPRRILESDAPRFAPAKLDAVLPQGDERPWFRQRLLPLLGIEATSAAEREELFTAWRRFLEHIAEQQPTVLVFEDLHWADEAMLAFLEHLADRAEGCAAARRRHRSARALRAPPRLRSRLRNVEHDQPRPALRRGDGAARRGTARDDRGPGRAASSRSSSGPRATRSTRRSSSAS